MRKLIQLAFIFIFMICKVHAQNPAIDSLVEEGIKLHDKADYEGAIELYTKALAIDRSAYRPNYEIASSYLHLKNYAKSIEYCDAILDSKSAYGAEVFTLKGTALDLAGDPKEAIKTYKKGVKKFTGSYLLYYNLGYTLYLQKEYKDAEEALQKDLVLKPTHASGHLAMAYLMDEQGNRIQSILALYNFLLIEPTSDRSAKAFALLDKLLSKGAKKTGEKETTIYLDMSKKSDEFSSAELMLGLMTATNTMDKNKDKTEDQLFAENTNMLFSVLGETKKKKGFWANFYIDFFYELSKAKHTDAFSYYISQSDPGESIKTWLSNNKEKTDALLKWVAAYERKS